MDTLELIDKTANWEGCTIQVLNNKPQPLGGFDDITLTEAFKQAFDNPYCRITVYDNTGKKILILTTNEQGSELDCLQIDPKILAKPYQIIKASELFGVARENPFDLNSLVNCILEEKQLLQQTKYQNICHSSTGSNPHSLFANCLTCKGPKLMQPDSNNDKIDTSKVNITSTSKEPPTLKRRMTH